MLVFVAVFAGPDRDPRPDRVAARRRGRRPARAAPCIHLLGCPADQPQHIFGTDSNFRDVFSRVVFGARTSLVIGLAAIGFAIFVGSTIGALAGYMSGWTDNIFMRFMDVILAFPSLLLAIVIVTAAGPEPVQRPDRDRHRRDTRVRPRRARVGAVLEGERLRHGVAGPRRIDLRRPDPADHAELDHAARRDRHARHRRRGPRDRGPGLRRRDRRHPARPNGAR